MRTTMALRGRNTRELADVGSVGGLARRPGAGQWRRDRAGATTDERTVRAGSQGASAPPGPARRADPPWTRWGLWALLALSAVVYFYDLSVNGYANSFYAAAVKSGTESWKALLFGALDSAGSITVDKPPAALWLMGLSARIFGFSSWSMLAPEALLGVGTVWLTHATVKRWAGAVAGLLAGLLVLVTPVAALMFRFNNPDALLTFTMVAAAYCVARAIDAPARVRGDGSRRAGAVRWMVGAGALIGIAFLTKLLQGVLVLPAFAAVYLLASPATVWTRVKHLLAGLAAFVVSAGWYVALVSLWPASARPYIGGSTNNSLWQLALGYDGLGRIFGASAGSSSGGGQGAGFGGAAGIARLFGTQFGTEISWFIPSALLLLVAGLIARGRAPRTDRLRAGLVLWGAWTLITGVVFSFMSGTIHPYYSVAMAPGLAGTIAFGAAAVWERRERIAWRAVVPVAAVLAAAWATYLLHRDAPSWMPWLGWTALALTVIGSVAAMLPTGREGLRRTGLAVLLAGSILVPAAWTTATIGTSHTDSNPTAGPTAALTTSSMGGGPGGMSRSGSQSGQPPTRPSNSSAPTGSAPSGSTSTGSTSTGSSSSTSSSSTSSSSSASTSSAPSGSSSGSSGQQGGGGGQNSANSSVVALLNSTTTEWSMATVGSQSAAPYILATNTSVMPIGGFTGSDNSPTLAQFQALVSQGKIHYFLAGDSHGGAGGSGSASAITSWVEAHYKTVTVGGVTLYDLTQPTSSS